MFPSLTDLSQVPPEAQPPHVDGSRYLINGEIRHWTGPTQSVESCIMIGGKRHVLAELHKIDKSTALEMLDAADASWQNGLGYWAKAGTLVRAEASKNFVNEMVKVREDVVRLLMWEIGKNRTAAEAEFDRTVEYINDTIDYMTKKHFDTDNVDLSEGGFFGLVRRSPLGIVLAMGPFNYPLNETFTTLLPAILMGNSCIVKLARYGSLCMLPLLEAFRDAYPPGVVNIYNGRGVDTASPIVQTGKIASLAFIGSSSVANSLRLEHPKPNRMRCTLGLDAKNPCIVLEDADLDKTIPEIISGALSFNGQRCTALKLILVQASIADEFVQRMSAAVDNLTVGFPWTNPTITPLPEHGKLKTLDAFVQDALSKGAQITNSKGGQNQDTFFFPTVVYPVSHDSDLWHKEQFGPIMPIATFNETSEIIDYLIHSDFGQQLSLFGEDPNVMGNLIDSMVNLVCRVNLNTQCRRGPDVFPFTGRKDSAEGTLDIISALRSFSIRTMVATPEKNKGIVTKIREHDASAFLANNH